MGLCPTACATLSPPSCSKAAATSTASCRCSARRHQDHDDLPFCEREDAQGADRQASVGVTSGTSRRLMSNPVSQCLETFLISCSNSCGRASARKAGEKMISKKSHFEEEIRNDGLVFYCRFHKSSGVKENRKSASLVVDALWRVAFSGRVEYYSGCLPNTDFLVFGLAFLPDDLNVAYRTKTRLSAAFYRILRRSIYDLFNKGYKLDLNEGNFTDFGRVKHARRDYPYGGAVLFEDGIPIQVLADNVDSTFLRVCIERMNSINAQ